MKNKIIIISVFMFLMASCKNEVEQTPNQIILSGLSFTPNSLTVPSGTIVSWLNNESVTHTVTSDSSEFDSGNMVKGDEFTYTFTKPGTYSYHCKYHSNMKGVIIVPTGSYQIFISGFKFLPAILNIPVGSSVSWTNNDVATHTATSTTSIFDSGDIPKGKSFTYKFMNAGTYPYYCIYHLEMTATIVVQ